MFIRIFSPVFVMRFSRKKSLLSLNSIEKLGSIVVKLFSKSLSKLFLLIAFNVLTSVLSDGADSVLFAEHCLIVFSIDRLAFHFHSASFFVVLFRDFCVSFYVHCFFHVRDFVVLNHSTFFSNSSFSLTSVDLHSFSHCHNTSSISSWEWCSLT